MARKADVHVVPKAGANGWEVKQGGKTVSEHRKQSTAIDAARSEAKHDKVDMVVHGVNGQIRQKDSFGNDPNPPKG